MSYRKFGKNDILINTLKANPRSEFWIYSSSIYYNNRGAQEGQYATNVRMTDPGFVSLYEYNIDKGTYAVPFNNAARTAAGGFSGPGTNSYIYPYLTKDSSRISLHMTSSAMTAGDWAAEFAYGDQITGSYPQYASIRREFVAAPSASDAGSSIDCRKSTTDCAHNYTYMSLRTTLDHYGALSDHYKVSSSYGNKNTQQLNIIHIPSIFYGNKIKPGTVSLRWYITGSLIAEVADLKQNGELIQTNRGIHSAGLSGSVQGVILYNEGFVVLTGSESITNAQSLNLIAGEGSTHTPKWKYWGAGARDGVKDTNFDGASTRYTFRSASFGMNFQGETTTETMTLYARAHRGAVNFSNNPTAIKYNQELLEVTSSHIYQENKERLIKNIVTSSYGDYEENFRRQVYISKIAVYDEQKNLIGIATLADPVLKDENEDYVFKLKIDI
jgi:hypothetical protein